MLFLDFDGVVCDAFTECCLVAWNGFARAPGGSPPSLDGGDVPPAFARSFRRIRPYARTLGGFAVAHHPRAGAVESRAGYEKLFATFGPAEIEAFERRAGAVRAGLRAAQPQRWLDLHHVYPQVGAAIARHHRRVVVVTAKDAGSVWEILGNSGLREHVLDVAGDCADKAAAIRAVRAEAGQPTGRALFVDDNLDNVLAVLRAGVPSRWARWGYHTEEHLLQAAEDGIDEIDLADLTRIEV